ncbi:MAG: TolC family outer membrane protein [Magnetococcales bacterium]|nr:TolC family outer membrane protein [Magnetococcales bacterium]
MSRDKTHIKIVFPLFFGMTIMSVTPTYAQTLQEAVATALRTNPKILAAQQEEKTFKEKTKQAKAGYLPVIALSAAHGQEYTTSPSTRNAGEDGVTLDRSELGLTLSQVLFDGLETKFSVDQAEAKYRSNTGKKQTIQENLTMEVVTAYLNALRDQELLELQDQNVALHKRILEKVKEMTKIGAGTEVDIHQSESRFALVASERETDNGFKLASETRFLNAVGEKSKNLTRPVIKRSLLPDSLEQAITVALANHPSLITSQADIDAAIVNKRSSQSSFWPTISLELAATNTANTSGTKSYTKSASAMLELSYNLFNGGSDVSKKHEAIENVYKLQEKYQEAQRNIREAVATAWHTLKTARNRISHIEKHVSVAKTVTKSFHDQFVMGSRSLVDVLDSESELHVAKKSLIVEQFQLMTGTFQLLSAMGVLNKTLAMPTKDVMQSIASKEDVLKVNSYIIHQLDDDKQKKAPASMPKIEIPKSGSKPETMNQTNPFEKLSREIELNNPDIVDLITEDGPAYSPDILEYIGEIDSSNADSGDDGDYIFDYLSRIDRESHSQ